MKLRQSNGPWTAAATRSLARGKRLVNCDIRNSMFFERAALADDVSRVSRKLHLRKGRQWVSMNIGILLEMIATMIGAGLIAAGVGTHSNLLAAVGALVWMATLQPLIKLMAGRLLGVEYDYLYLLAIEPRLKMRYGTYLTRPRLFRVIVHLATARSVPRSRPMAPSAVGPSATRRGGVLSDSILDPGDHQSGKLHRGPAGGASPGPAAPKPQ